MLRISTPLSREVEAQTAEAIGACIAVHRTLGPGELLCQQRLDFVVADSIVLELKAVERLSSVHEAQIISYLRASGLRVGLLITFNVAVLKQGIRRLVL